MNEKQIQELIARLAENTEALRRVAARDPEKEFSYREGYVGANSLFGPCPKAEGIKISLEVDASGWWYFYTTIYPQFWRIDFAGQKDAAGSNTDIFNGLQFEFSNDNFRSVSLTTFERFDPTQYNALSFFRIKTEFPVRFRYLRMRTGYYAGSGDGYQSPFVYVAPGTMFTRYSMPNVAIFGE